jgi:hypothetical protein
MADAGMVVRPALHGLLTVFGLAPVVYAVWTAFQVTPVVGPTYFSPVENSTAVVTDYRSTRRPATC